MHSTRHGWLAILGWTALTAALCAQAQAPSRPEGQEQKTPASRPETPSTPSPQRGLDDLGIPPNAVIVIHDDPQKALNSLPKGVLLSPERYQELRKLEVESAQRQSNLIKVAVPTSCKLSGQVDGDLAQIHVEFKIVIDKPRTLVALGCQRGWTRSAMLDGKLPLLVADPKEEGLFVQVEEPGKTHVLVLELAVPLAGRGTKGTERGFDLGLPRCAITQLDHFQIPGEYGDVRLNGRAVRTRVEAARSRIENEPLGVADHLDISWKSAAAPANQGPPLTSAEGRWTVRVEEKRIVTDVELQLQVLRAEVEQWRIQVPRGALFDLREPGPQDERIDRRELPTEQLSELVLHLKKPSAEPLRVVFQVQQKRADTGNPVGPFVVADALRQHGVIGVTAPTEFRLNYRTYGNTMPRDSTDEPGRSLSASFAYWSLPAHDGAVAAPLELDVQPFKGVVEARVEHFLELTPGGWHAQTKIEFNPVRTGVDTIEIQVPENYPFDNAKGVGPAELADPPVLDLKRRLATVKLAQKQTRPFSLTLTAVYAVAAGQQQIVLALPKPLQAFDKGCRTVIVLPTDLELASRTSETESPVPGNGKAHQYARTWERTPERVDIAWRTYRPELRVDSLLDVTVHSSQASVRQRLDLQFPGRAPDRLPLSVPAQLAERVKVLQGGVLEDHGVVKLDRTESKTILILTYDVPFLGRLVDSRIPTAHAGERLVPFPMVRVLLATHVQTKARFWCDATRQLSIAEGPWDEAPVEAVPERESLPALVLRSMSLDDPLTLLQHDGGKTAQAPLVVERALVQVVATAGDHHTYRARFLLGRIATRQIDFELPGPVSGANLAVFLDGKRITTLRSLDANGNSAENGTVARIAVEPDLYHKPVILDVRYQLNPGRRRGNFAMASTFYPPEFSADVLRGPVRWQLELPSGSVFLYRAGTYDSEQAWTWHGLLLSPIARTETHELERWLSTSPSLDPAEALETSVSCWRSELAPIQIVAFPQPAWLLIWSALTVGAGILLLLIPWALGLRLAALAGLTLAVAFASIIWPSVLPAILYGSEPGLAVLVVVLIGSGLGRLFERRRSLYLPGFSRLRNGSALLKTGSSLNKKREPTTVDAPAPRGSSVIRQRQPQEP